MLLGWTVLAQPWLWTLAVVGILLLPPASACLLELLRKPGEVLLRQHVVATAGVAGRNAAQAAFTLACLPYEAMVNLDAIARTAWRLLVSHRRCLEWSPSVADAPGHRRAEDAAERFEFAMSLGRMWIAPVTATLATVLLLALSASSAWAVAAPILLLWFVAPALAWWVSRPLVRRETRLTEGQAVFLRGLARRTWAWFDAFVGEDDHWLPPDNRQEHPVARLAHRTSPTNMGLALLANLAARDFGYITGGALVLRTANALRSMGALERYEGHFYNWYDTHTMQPLRPLYVSAVDSGNLAGHLFTLRAGLSALADEAILDARWFEGLGDTLRTLAGTIDGAAPASIARLHGELEAAVDSRPNTMGAARKWLDRLQAGVAAVVTDVAIRAAPVRLPRRPRTMTPRTGRRPWRASTRACGTSCRHLHRRARTRHRQTVRAGRQAAATFRRCARLRHGKSRQDRPPRDWRKSRISCASATNWPACSTTFSTTPRGTCWRSATTWPKAAATRATTTCSPRRPGSRASWRSPRGSCHRRTGSRWGAC